MQSQLKQSNSSAAIPLHEKVRELIRITRHYSLGAGDRSYLNEFFENIRDYDALLRNHAADVHGLSDARALEIGFGARPNRLFALHSMGVDATGVDLDVPALSGTPAEFLRMIKRNSLERAIKSFLRFYLFDLRERRALAAMLEARGHRFSIRPEKFMVMAAEEAPFKPDSFDLIYSEGVFEHIPPQALQRLVEKMASWIRPSGLALITPNIFPGIVGGHIVEWVWPPTKIARRSEPWDHIRKRQYRPNTYLNELTRREYREIFSRHFVILEERVRNPDLGREYMTPEIRAELAQWDDEELFSNAVMFVLKPKSQ